MKQHKVFLSFVIVAAMLFASILPAYGIGFVAEDAFCSVFIVCSGDALGSGFAMGRQYIVTNAHVIGNPRSVVVYDYDGTKYSAQVVGMDEDQDIAVLLVPEGNFRAIAVADEKTLRIGDDVYAIGAPKSMAYTLTKGVISAKARQVGDYSYIQTDAPINEGNSGGPLLNDAGQVLGMNTMKMLDSEGLGLAIPISRICTYLVSLGFVMDGQGTVTDAVLPTIPTQPADTQPPATQPPNQLPQVPVRPEQNVQKDSGTPVWVAICAVSVALNVILLILLIRKKKIPEKTCDPTERTDFEIDILE